VTGCIVDDIEEAVRTIGLNPKLSRWRCRQYCEERFSALGMVQDYLVRKVPLLPPTLTLGMQVDLSVSPDSLAATQGISDYLGPHNSRPLEGGSVQLGEEGAELRHEQRP
jgi:hypothetical protein